MLQWDSYEFKVAGHFLSALINADESGMSDEESAEFNAWEESARQNARNSGFTIGHWSCDSEESDEWGRCDVTGLFAMRQTVKLHVYKD